MAVHHCLLLPKDKSRNKEGTLAPQKSHVQLFTGTGTQQYFDFGQKADSVARRSGSHSSVQSTSPIREDHAGHH